MDLSVAKDPVLSICGVGFDSGLDFIVVRADMYEDPSSASPTYTYEEDLLLDDKEEEFDGL